MRSPPYTLTAGGIAEARGGNTSLSDADVMVKLNKRDGRPVWTFEISGRVSLLREWKLMADAAG